MNELFSPDAYARVQKLPDLLLPWYDSHKRDLPWRINTDPYRVWISEIMLQQTRVEAVKEHYLHFLRTLPDVHALAECREDTLFKLWEGLGYYSRARNLQKAAKIIDRNGFPRTERGLRSLPGIGDYTAGAIASIAFEEATPAVDGNVVRVLSRLLGDERSPTFLKKALRDLLACAYPPLRRGDFTQSLMELGATVCLPASPLCLTCPLLQLCDTHSDALPAREPKAVRRKIPVTVLLFHNGSRIALCKRENGLLRGTYGFFTIERAMEQEDAARFLQDAGLNRFALGKEIKHNHVFSHIEWNMTAFPVACETDVSSLTLPESIARDGIVCTRFQALSYHEKSYVERELSLPTAFRWCLQYL